MEGSNEKLPHGDSSRLPVLPNQPAVVLHIDDDPNDAELFRAAAVKARAAFELQSVDDGEKAIAYLKGTGPYADRERYHFPKLILLDLKLPRATGFEILSWIRSHEEFADVPVVILSGSELQDDIYRAYNAGANSYLVKPLGFDALVSLIRSIVKVWLTAEKPEK
ncbi:MAG TPA: response regulator [Clostridia bacterium]|nr:response regulator [Clostridia bacterium]